MELSEFDDTIKYLLKRVPASKDEKRDLTQDCYVALLEEQDKVDSADKPERYACRLCWSVIVDHWRKKYGHGKERRPRVESLSDPKNFNRASKVADSGIEGRLEDLAEGIGTLPYDEYQVMYCVYVEGMTEQETADDLEKTVRQIQHLKVKAIRNLQAFFKVA